jgi:signal transduction histidine kinase
MNLRLRYRVPMRRSLRRQLVASVAGVHMVLMIAFVYDLVDRQQGFLIQRARARVLHEVEVVAASAVPQLITSDFAGLQEVLESVKRDKAIVAAWVTTEKGRIVGHSEYANVGRYVTDETSVRILKQGRETAIFGESERVIQGASPVTLNDRVIGWAWVTGDLTADRAQIASVRQEGILYMVIATAAGVVFAIVLANGITRQLRLLLAGTKRLADNRLDVPVTITSDNEVGQVAKAFNGAMHRLADQQAEVLRARNELEAEVIERRRAQKELQDANNAIMNANERLREFAYAASHDLQEPLRAVTGYAELLQKRYKGRLDSDGDDFLAYVHDGAQRMQRLIGALLEYSRAGGRGDAPREIVDANRALRAAVDNLQTAVETSGAEILHRPLPSVSAHEVALVQLFQNLLGNAIKYAGRRRPEIRVWAERDGEQWRFAVEDNGLGIAPKDHQRIFGLFKRAHGGDFPGTGVGLAICNKLVHRYGGRLWVDSELDKGATFWFTLPAAGRGGDTPAVSGADNHDQMRPVRDAVPFLDSLCAPTRDAVS